MTEHNPYKKTVEAFSRAHSEAKNFHLGEVERLDLPRTPKETGQVLLFSPHPDDECITGGLPLRLLREQHLNVINVAVTLGSNLGRQSERREELTNACLFLNFDLINTQKIGLKHISPWGKKEFPIEWEKSVATITKILTEQNPSIIFFPHAGDWNTTHVGVNILLLESLSFMPSSFSCTVIETEFWGAMDNPNLMIESSIEDVADLIAATSFHVKEVQRNLYHTRLPAWMMDNVRRGSELVNGQGSIAPDFTFATLYRMRAWKQNTLQKILYQGKLIAASDQISKIFN